MTEALLMLDEKIFPPEFRGRPVFGTCRAATRDEAMAKCFPQNIRGIIRVG